ncbi:MAG: Stp1/IreP family PP2C-type Ser/Thr phosphatase [Clostridium sp.]|nr:Stp1/IreP family PP2C-type Ser/Thr phosphatase [Clostridium sp.]MCM1398215.1 Stp1/IreP family PP2C-type Ser/Thr phosphatase [Clostridium sp.]MCM1460371.1 Stp1/IreP family PP2C-type Ser/Thr phosphatase [Bacteroides sp.]
MKSCGKTDTGNKRSNNQDSIFYSDKPIGMMPNLYIVADGMGGHRAGDKASRMAIDITVDFIKDSTLENPIAILKRAIVFANNEIFKAAGNDPDLQGMGTTMVAAIALDGKLYVANIGDSRLYAINSEIKQITMDHSLVEELIRNGELERKKGRNHPERNIITKAMGSKEEIVPDFFEVDIHKGERFLLCSDGLSNMVEDDEIRDIVVEHDDLKEMTQALIDRANYYGGSDNISVVVVEE